MDRSEIKRQLHAARSALQYQSKTDRPARGDRDAAIAEARARVDELDRLYKESAPFEPTLVVRNDNFIGPKRKRGARGDGPTITCFRCEETKPREEFYSKGTVCKACFVKKAVEWADRNQEKAMTSKRKCATKNKDKRRTKSREYYLKNIDKQRERGRKYYIENREQRLISVKACAKRRRKTDPKYRALITCKRRMWILFKSVGLKKKLRSAELLGTDRAGLFSHLESLFKPGMTWANRGLRGWHIDHVRPVALHDMRDPEQAKACWHYKNLQPLWWYENLKKSDKYEEPKDIDRLTKEPVPEIATAEKSVA